MSDFLVIFLLVSYSLASFLCLFSSRLHVYIIKNIYNTVSQKVIVVSRYGIIKMEGWIWPLHQTAANVLRPWHPGAALSYRLKRMQGPSHLERTLQHDSCCPWASVSIIALRRGLWASSSVSYIGSVNLPIIGSGWLWAWNHRLPHYFLIQIRQIAIHHRRFSNQTSFYKLLES